MYIVSKETEWRLYENSVTYFWNFLHYFQRKSWKKNPLVPTLSVCVHTHACKDTNNDTHKTFWYTLNRKNAESHTYLLYLFQQISQTLTSLPAQHLQCCGNNRITDEQNNKLPKKG